MSSINEDIVTALYDYHAKDLEELTIRKNEQLTLLDGTGPWYKVRNKVMQVGLVPSNYVKCKGESLVNRIANRFPGTRKSSKGGAGGGTTAASNRSETSPTLNTPGRFNNTNNFDRDSGTRRLGNDKTMSEKYVAKYSYTATRPDELDLVKGLTVHVTTKENDGWWQGRNVDGETGWFPSNYVEESSDPPAGDNYRNNSLADTAVPSAARPVLEVARALYAFNSGNPEELPFEAGDMFDIIGKPESDPEWYEARNADGRTGLIPINYIETVPGAPSVFLPEASNYDDVSRELSNNTIQHSESTGNGDGPDSMSSKPWYFGPIRRAEAETMLTSRARNSEFMVRDSESTRGDLSVSMKAPDRIKHFKVSLRNGKYCIGQRKFDSVEVLIEHYRRAPIYTAQDIGKIYLSQPMQR